MEGQMTIFDIRLRPTFYEIFTEYGVPIFKLKQWDVPLSPAEEVIVRKKAAKAATYRKCMESNNQYNYRDKEND